MALSFATLIKSLVVHWRVHFLRRNWGSYGSVVYFSEQFVRVKCQNLISVFNVLALDRLAA